MTDVELSALEAAAKAATPGPWADDGEEKCLGRGQNHEVRRVLRAAVK